MKKLVVLLLINPALVSAQSYVVMTYNIRYDNPGDGPNAWPNRKASVFSLIQKNEPDILGVQEALNHQLEDIKNNTHKYIYVGVGRDDGNQKGEYSAIFFKKEKFEVTTSGTFWLSETPDIPGSKNWDAAITRIATWAKVLDRKAKDTILVVNTHFDHVGKLARENSARILKEKISVLARALPVVLTGDFNIEPTETPYSILTNGETYNLHDTGAGDSVGTYCTFQPNSEPCKRIDYIFYGVGWQVKSYSVINQNNGTYYPSDHLPVIAKLKLNH